MPNQKITKKLSKYQLTLTNATDPEILEATSTFNYDEAKLAEGINLLNQARQFNIQQEKEYGEQYSATNRLNQAFSDFKNTSYIPHLKVARKLFPRDHGSREMLGLNGPRKTNYDEWANEVRLFYSNALSTLQIKDKLALVNITEEILQAGLDKLTELDLLRAEQRKESGEAQQATDKRDQALDQINEWMGLYYTIAKIALANKPQLLEKLGVKA